MSILWLDDLTSWKQWVVGQNFTPALRVVPSDLQAMKSSGAYTEKSITPERKQTMTTQVLRQRQPPDFSDPTLWKHLTSCPLCGASVFRNLPLARDWHYGNPGLFQIVECESCRLNFLNPMPTLECLATAYPQDYYAYEAPTVINPSSASRLHRTIRRLLLYSPEQLKYPATQPGILLDIGCGSGAFLAEVKSRGWDAKGVELDANAALRGREAGLDIFSGTIDAAHYPSSSFDYVRSRHSFEHIHNSREVLREIRRIIKPGGTLLIEVPNVAGLAARIFGRYWWYLCPPVHTFGYSPATLSRLLAQEGFQVETVQYNSTYAGLVGSLQIYLNRNNGKSPEKGWVIENRAAKVAGYRVARLTDTFRCGDVMEVTARPV